MTLLSILLTIGLPAIDESLDKLLVAMETFPNVAVLGDAVGLAKAVGLLLALCAGSYECWMMMLGRRGMDVMKLLRIIGISICISSSSWICSALQVPGKGLESATKAMAQSKNKEVAAFELKVAQKQGEYLERLRAVQDSISAAKQVAAIGEDASWWDKLIYNVENLGNTINTGCSWRRGYSWPSWRYSALSCSRCRSPLRGVRPGSNGCRNTSPSRCGAS